MRELDRLKIIQAVFDGLLKPGHAAERLSLTDHKVRRLVNWVRDKVQRASYIRPRAQPGNHRLPTDLAKMALDLIRNRYHAFGLTLACKQLREIYGLYLSKETVRKLMARPVCAGKDESRAGAGEPQAFAPNHTP